MNIDPAASSIHYKGRKLPHFDAVIPRIGSQITYYGTAALRQFEMLGSYPLNESVAISRARDKLRSLQLLARQGIDLPVTGIAHSPDDTSDLIDMVGGAPLVIKLVEGTQGIGVVLAETRQAAESVIDAFRGLNAHILVQEYIEEAKGRDIRCFVVGNEVVAAIERQAKEGDFRSNLHRGGVARVADISEREREIAVKAAQTLGLDVAGVDLLRATRGPLVMEVNASPGLEGVEKTTGVDIAAMDLQVVPTLDTLRQWLDDAGITFFECDSCQALHLPHMQNFDGIFDAKIDLINDVILFSALAEVKPSALLALASDLSAINASSLTVKAFLDIQDDNLPKLVVCQSLFSGAGLSFKQFAWFMRLSEEQISMVMMEANAHHLLYSAEDDAENNDASPNFLH
ncbi:hypothetical protein ID866_3157 [Astraeus odoratus]|nr:hypothetical protein ID866_3157 [Astraeus odoratus]